MERHFNLVDEPWIPVVDFGRISLRQLFSDDRYRRLSGNPVQKIALLKLLLSIAQAACTPDDDDEWKALGSRGLANRCLDYLQCWHDRFWLYGEHPFLQMPTISKAAVQSFSAVSPEIATGNTTLLNQSQKGQPLDDADKALLLVCLAGFALAGKKTDNRVVLTPGYTGKQNDKGKPSSGRAGPSLEFLGLLHSLYMGETLLETLWFNLLTCEDLSGFNHFSEGVGTAVWERIPEGEDCEIAQRLKSSLQGRLVPLCRFCLLSDAGLHYSEGIQHPSYRDQVVDPTVSVNFSKKKPQVLWANPEKRPWREIASLLGFLQTDNNNTFQTLQLSATLPRIRQGDAVIALWCGGLRVSSNAGEQYASGTDDYVESETQLHTARLGSIGFEHLKLEVSRLESLAKILYGSVCAYFKHMGMSLEDAKSPAEQTTHRFWQLCERNFQQLVNLSFNDPEALGTLRRHYAGYLWETYDKICPRETARQIEGWAAHRPNAGKYLSQGS
jgi:CRISPR system Cascade subunit CasA